MKAIVIGINPFRFGEYEHKVDATLVRQRGPGE